MGRVMVHAPGGESGGGVYGVCSSSGSAMDVNIAGLWLGVGAIAIVKFAYGVPRSATLNINGTGAKPIKWCGASIEYIGILAGDTCEFVYTGSSWDLLAIDRLAATGGANSVSFAADSWETIQKVCSQGMHKSCYSIGDTKTIMMDDGETIIVRIEDFDHDDLDSGGKAPLSIAFMDGTRKEKYMNPNESNSGGWGASSHRTGMNDMLSKLPADLQLIIKTVNKKSSAGSKSSSIVTTKDKLWLFSYTEAGFAPNSRFSPGGEGTPYPLFTSNASRIKKVNGSAAHWWLRSPCIENIFNFCFVNSDGNCYDNASNITRNVVLGFCI